MKEWEDLILETAERFGGTFPHPETAAEIAAVNQRAPNAVQREIDDIADAYTNGKINSPWGILRSRVSKITADVQPKASTTNDRNKAIARAEQWIRTAGLHYDRPDEILDELYGERGRLRQHPDTRQRMLELWQDLQPIGQQLEADQAQRLARWRQHQDTIA